MARLSPILSLLVLPAGCDTEVRLYDSGSPAGAAVPAEAWVDSGEPLDTRPSSVDGGDQGPAVALAANLLGREGDHLGYRFSLTTADLDGDGLAELVTGGMYLGESYQGGLYVVPPSVTDGDHAISGQASTSLLGEDWGFVGGGHAELGDLDGDGAGELLAFGSPSSAWGGVATNVAIFLDAPSMPDQLALQQSDVRIVGTGGDGYATGHASLDLHGDGFDDLVYGDWLAELSTVSVFSGADLVMGPGVRSLSEADYTLEADPWGAQLGRSLSGGDVDGDGIDELAVTAFDGTSALLYLVEGSGEPSADSVRFVVESHSADGTDLQILLADLDDDERVDLAVGAPDAARVGVFSDAATLGGRVRLADADHVVDHDVGTWFGTALVAVDHDGDGLKELVVGAPGGSQVRVAPSTEGAVWWFDALAPGWQAASAQGVQVGDAAPDLRGHALVTWDGDSDGRAELFSAAPLADGGAGAVQRWRLE